MLLILAINYFASAENAYLTLGKHAYWVGIQEIQRLLVACYYRPFLNDIRLHAH